MKLRQTASKSNRPAGVRMLVEAMVASVRAAFNDAPQAMQHSVLFGKHCRDAIPRMQVCQGAGLFDVIRLHVDVKTPDQARAANRNRCRRGVGPDYGSDDQIFLNGFSG